MKYRIKIVTDNDGCSRYYPAYLKTNWFFIKEWKSLNRFEYTEYVSREQVLKAIDLHWGSQTHETTIEYITK